MTYGFDEEERLTGDINHDSQVDSVDMALLAEKWMNSSCGACDGADLTSDGVVNYHDLHELTRNWLGVAIQ